MDGALIAVRFLHYGAAMLLWGQLAYGGAPKGRGALWGLMLLTGGLWLMLEAGVAGNGWPSVTDPAVIRALLADTPVGQAWVMHMALVALLGPALHHGAGRTLPLAGAALASLALVGHAAMDQGGLGMLHRLNAALHLLAAGYWLGALPAVLRGLGAPGEEARLMRFSRWGHLAVAGVLLTGLGNTLLVLHHLPDDLASAYQGLLIAKMGLVAAMVALAVLNRYVFVPRLARGGLPGLRRGTLAEIALGIAVLALVSAFATFDPV